MFDVGYLLPPDPDEWPSCECSGCGAVMIYDNDAWYCPNPFCCDDFLYIPSYLLRNIPEEWEKEYNLIENDDC